MRLRWQPHAAREFVRLFVEALFKHRKRGNRHIPPLGFVKSWRAGQCARMIILGPPYRLRWMEKAMAVEKIVQERIAIEVARERARCVHLARQKSCFRNDAVGLACSTLAGEMERGE